MNEHEPLNGNGKSPAVENDENTPEVPEEAPRDVAERPGDTSVDQDHADNVADEWGEESFPASDPPAHY